MKIVAQPIPTGSQAVRVCDDDGTPRFVCIVTPHPDHAWIWMGLGAMNRRVSSKLRAFLRSAGHSIVKFERLDNGQFQPHQIVIRGQ